MKGFLCFLITTILLNLLISTQCRSFRKDSLDEVSASLEKLANDARRSFVGWLDSQGILHFFLNAIVNNNHYLSYFSANR